MFGKILECLENPDFIRLCNVVKEIQGGLNRGSNFMILKEFLQTKMEFQEVMVGHEAAGNYRRNT